MVYPQKFIAYSLEAKMSKLRVPADPVSGENCFLVYTRNSLAMSSHGKARELPGVSFIRTLIPKSPSINTITLGLGFQCMNLGGGGVNTQIIAPADCRQIEYQQGYTGLGMPSLLRLGIISEMIQSSLCVNNVMFGQQCCKIGKSDIKKYRLLALL
jgi:hypothetical protein